MGLWVNGWDPGLNCTPQTSPESNPDPKNLDPRALNPTVRTQKLPDRMLGQLTKKAPLNQPLNPADAPKAHVFSLF